MSIVWLVDENQEPLALYGHGPWLLCEVALRHDPIYKCLIVIIPIVLVVFVEFYFIINSYSRGPFHPRIYKN
jgi:hypothetical protein